MYDGWQRRRHRDLTDLAGAVRAAMAESPDAIAQALPEPTPLTGTTEDDWDRSQWWTASYETA